jgi:hypothetical protein
MVGVVKKKSSARKKILESEDENRTEEEERTVENEKEMMETDTAAVAGPSGLLRTQVNTVVTIQRIILL